MAAIDVAISESLFCGYIHTARAGTSDKLSKITMKITNTCIFKVNQPMTLFTCPFIKILT